MRKRGNSTGFSQYTSELLKSGVAGLYCQCGLYRPGECYRYASEYLNTILTGVRGLMYLYCFTKPRYSGLLPIQLPICFLSLPSS